MGDFTSKYKVTYGNGTTQTESRVDAGKVFDNAFVPLFLLALAVIALIAAIPFLLVIPVLLYIYTPYKKVKNLLKSNENIKDYSDEFLASKGYKTFGALASSIKIKFYLVIVLILVACGFIDYYMFTNYELNKLGKFAMTMLEASLPILVAYPLALLLFFKNRKVLFELLDVESTFGQRFFRFTLRHYKKIIFLVVLSVSFSYGSDFYFDYKNKRDYNRYSDLTYEMKKAKPTEENIVKLQALMEENSIEINDSIYGNASLYKLTEEVNNIIYGDEAYYYNAKDSMKYETSNLLEGLLNSTLYSKTYNKRYQEIFNRLSIYTKLGGDLNIVNASTGKTSLEMIDTIETYNAAKKLGANFDGIEYDVIIKIIKELGKKDEGYSKRLANLLKNIEPKLAKKILWAKEDSLKYNKQMSALRVLEKLAAKSHTRIN